MVFNKYVDERGIFQEIYKNSEMFEGFDPEQISFCTINPDFVRGRHYHKQMLEVFIVIEGEMEITQQWIENGVLLGDPDIFTMTPDRNQMVVNEPNQWHSVTSDNGCKFIIITDKEFDPDDPDTYKL